MKTKYFQNIWTGKSKWLKRFGIASFFFFLIKGLIWIGVAMAIWFGARK
jgi:hypothetical protein